MVPITETSGPDDAHSDEDAAGPTVAAAETEPPDTLLCWICRQPLGRVERVRWHGEPVHRDCR